MTSTRVLGILVVAVLAPRWPAAAVEPADERSAAAMATALGALREARPGMPGAPALDPRLAAVARSPELSREFGDLTEQIFADLVAWCDGDPQKMQDVLTRAQSEPEAFTRALRPETQARLEALSRKLEQQPQ